MVVGKTHVCVTGSDHESASLPAFKAFDIKAGSCFYPSTPICMLESCIWESKKASNSMVTAIKMQVGFKITVCGVSGIRRSSGKPKDHAAKTRIHIKGDPSSFSAR